LDLRAIETPAQAAAVCDRIAATAAPDDVLSEARTLVADAKALLDGDVSVAERAVFDAIADQAVGRSN
jgi:hypothetical protein